MEIGDKELEKVLMSQRRAYKCFNLKEFIKERKKRVKMQNKDLIPCIDERYWCETCGSRSHKCHPDTSYCFICDTDNWKLVGESNIEQ